MMILAFSAARQKYFRSGGLVCPGPVAGAGTDPVALPSVADDLDVDLAEAFIWVRRRVVGHGVGVTQIFADRFKRFHLFLPRLGPVGLAAGALGDAAEDAAADGILVHV